MATSDSIQDAILIISIYYYHTANNLFEIVDIYTFVMLPSKQKGGRYGLDVTLLNDFTLLSSDC